MRILYFDFELPYLVVDADVPVGGAAVEWSNWIEGFSQNGSKVGVITWKGAKKFLSGHDCNFDVIDTFSPKDGIRYIRIISIRLPHYIRAIRQYKPDVVIQGCAGITTGLLCLASKIVGVPFVYRGANDMDADNRHKARMSKMEAWFYSYGIRNAKAIVCQNEYQYSKFLENFPDKEIAKIYNPYDCSALDTSSTRNMNRSYVAWLGVFQKQKNLPALYKIVKALPDVEFRIGGKRSSKGVDAHTEKAINLLEKAPNVKFQGYIRRTDIPSFLNKAYLLLNTSHYEGFSNTFLESFSVGTPIVTTKKVDPDGIIEKNYLGLVGENYDQLPEKIQSILLSTGQNKFSLRCKKYLNTHHNHIDQANLFLSFLEKVISK